jgi:drug/metabolite transporter (DMT)-like permease
MQATAAPAHLRATTNDITLFSILLVVDSLHFVFARALLPHFNPVLSATLVLWIATLQIGIFGTWRGQIHWSSMRTHFWFYTSIGVLVGASTALGYSAVAFIDPGTASMLSKTSTLFSILIGIVWLGERLRPRQWLGTGLALVGVVLITFQPGDLLRWGAGMVLLATVMYALHAAIVKRYGNSMGFIDFFFFRLLFTSLALTLPALIVNHTWQPIPPASAWGILFLAGTVDVVISRSLYYLALRRLPMSLHAIVLTLSPVLTVGWAMLLFATFPKPLQLVGGIIVVIGVGLATVTRRR